MKISCALAVVAAVLTGCEYLGTGTKFDARATALEPSLTSVPSPAALDPSWLQPPNRFFTLGPGDQLEIEVVGELASRESTVVGPDGKLYYYLLPGMDVWGLTLAETKARIEHQLTDYIRGQPKVSVILRRVASKRVWLLGRLDAPGVYSMEAPMTLLEAIALAGGPSNSATSSSAATTSAPSAPQDLADLHHSFVLRGGQRLPIDFERLLRDGDLSQNIYLQSDDFVYLPSYGARVAYVLGAVPFPQAVSASGRLSLVAAIATAGGTSKDAYLDHVAVVRGSLTSPKIAIVDLSDVLKGKATDVLLEPGDIVYVPLTPYHTLTRYANLILDTFARTVGADEGVKAASRSNSRTNNALGVSVPISISVGQ